MKSKQAAAELYAVLLEGLYVYQELELKDKYEKVYKLLESHWKDVKLLVINNKKQGLVEKLVLILMEEIKENDIKYMEAIKEDDHIWITYRVT